MTQEDAAAFHADIARMVREKEAAQAQEMAQRQTRARQESALLAEAQGRLHAASTLAAQALHAAQVPLQVVAARCYLPYGWRSRPTWVAKIIGRGWVVRLTEDRDCWLPSDGAFLASTAGLSWSSPVQFDAKGAALPIGSGPSPKVPWESRSEAPTSTTTVLPLHNYSPHGDKVPELDIVTLDKRVRSLDDLFKGTMVDAGVFLAAEDGSAWIKNERPWQPAYPAVDTLKSAVADLITKHRGG